MVFARSALVFALLSLAGCTAPAQDPAPVWYGDMQVLVQENCAGCHNAGGIAPVSLNEYAAAAAAADRMADRTADHSMPPWLPGRGCNEYTNDRSLSDAEIARFAAWAAAGAPEGNPEDEVDLEEPEPMRADLTMVAPAYVPNDQGQEDDYRCFELDHGLTETRYVTGIDTRPGVDRMVHHVVYFVVGSTAGLDDGDPGPGWTCFGGPGTNNFRGVLGGWAPGMAPVDYPAGTGIALGPNDLLVMQVHYNFENGPAVEDVTEVSLRLEEQVDKVGDNEIIGDFGFAIPPRTDEFVVRTSSGALAGDSRAVIHGVIPHMHVHGKEISVNLRDGDEDACIVDIPRWDFNWQELYFLEEPERVDGRQIRLRCAWFNDTDEFITYGDGTSDEMCLAFVYVTR